MAGASAVSSASGASSALAAFGSFLREELAPRPGRLAGAVRTAVCCCVVTAVAMVLQIPDPFLAAFLVFVISREDVVASVVVGLAAVVATTLAIALALVITAFDAGSSPLFGFLSWRSSRWPPCTPRARFRVGPAAFLAGFVLVKLQAAIDGAPNTEELVRGMLWLWVVVALPVGVVVLVQLATGQRPATKARQSGLRLLRALADSLRRPGAGDLRARHSEAVALVASTRRAAMVDATAKGRLGSDLRLVETLETLLSMQDVLPAETPPALRGRLADECDACAKAFERGETAPPPAQPVASQMTSASAPVGVRPVVYAMAAALERLREGLDRMRAGVSASPWAMRFVLAMTDDRERADNLKFAVKSTLAVMCAYFIYTGLALPEIATAVTTCFFVSLGSLGESIQKLTLRIAGALVGGVAAGLCIAFVRPSMTDIGQLVLLVGAATGICAWVTASSVRLSYMGLQMALAFLLRHSAGPRAALALQGSVLPRRRDSPRKRACHRHLQQPVADERQGPRKGQHGPRARRARRRSSAPGRPGSAPGSRCSSRSTRRASSMPLRSSSVGMIPEAPSAEAEQGMSVPRARESRRARLRRGRVARIPGHRRQAAK